MTRKRRTRWQSDSETSKAGADAAEHSAQSQAGKVLAWLEAAGREGLTSDQLYDLFNAGIDQGNRTERMKRTLKGSVRRATCVLAEEEAICEATDKRPGEYRIPLIVWVAMQFATPEEKAAQETKLLKRRQRRGRTE